MTAGQTFYRIFFRRRKGSAWYADQPSIVVEGELERDRILARKVPKAIHWEVAKIHQCSVCGDERPWTDEWAWYGSYQDIDDGKPLKKFCSKDCRAKHELGGKVWDGQHEPREASERHEHWKTVRAAEEKSNHRKVPMPEWPGPGSCRWCLKPTIWESGKRAGQPAPTRNWHNACYDQYLLHTAQAVQWEHLAARDGPWCAICGPKEGHWVGRLVFLREYEQTGLTRLYWSVDTQVDHKIPLWRVWEFKPSHRRRLYGPENLWLLCHRHHLNKTAVEAAQRAALRRSPPDL